MMFPIIHGLVGTAAGGGAGNPGVGINFGGTDEYLDRGTGLTGASDGKKGLFSCWFKTGSAANQRIISSTGQTLDVFQDGAQTFRIDARTSGGTRILRIHTAATIDDDAWHHLLASWDMAANKFMYLDDASDLVSVTFDDDTIDYTVADWAIGAQVTAANKMNGCLADVWFNNEYLDLSVVANRRKFIDGSGNPVDLGSDGSFPTSTTPLLFFSDVVANWHINKGSGGGFTENGTLTDCATDP